MATTSYPVNDAMAVKTWSRRVAWETLKSTAIAPLIGSDENSIIVRKDEMNRGPGDQVTCTLFTTPEGDGFSEGERVEGNAESLTNYTDSLVINELGHAVGVRSRNTIDQQRVPFDLRAQANRGLRDWWKDRMSESFFKQVCGYTAETITKRTGMQAPTAPTSGRVIRQGGHANDQSITSADTFTLDLIDKAKEIAETADVPVRPIMMGGEEMYVIYIHPYQVTSLRTNTSTGQWQDLQKAAMMGGQVSDNPIWRGSLGMYNNVIIRKAFDVTQGVNSSTSAAVTTVRRAVLLGASAAYVAFGQRHGEGRFRMNEELLDHKRELEVSAWSVWGLKKCVYNSQDYGVVTIPTYAVAAS